MNSLLPPNATALERSVEQATARLGSVPVPLRDLWNADTCPTGLLPWLAWALGIVGWKSYWPESVKRETIRNAITIAKQRGTRTSVQKVVSNFGANVVLKEWWEPGGSGEPYTFGIVINYGQGAFVTEQFQEDIIREITRAKPARAHFTVTTGFEATGAVGLAGYARAATYTRLQMEA